MKPTLILIAVVSLGWILYVPILPTVVVHAQMDAVIPPSAWEKTTPEERKTIRDGLRKLNPRRNDLALLVPPALILALCAYGLRRGRRTPVG